MVRYSKWVGLAVVIAFTAWLVNRYFDAGLKHLTPREYSALKAYADFKGSENSDINRIIRLERDGGESYLWWDVLDWREADVPERGFKIYSQATDFIESRGIIEFTLYWVEGFDNVYAEWRYSIYDGDCSSRLIWIE